MHNSKEKARMGANKLMPKPPTQHKSSRTPEQNAKEAREAFPKARGPRASYKR